MSNEWCNFKIICKVCTNEVDIDKLYLAKRGDNCTLICIDCECGANNILKIIDSKELKK